jgi:hypothetical protein
MQLLKLHSFSESIRSGFVGGSRAPPDRPVSVRTLSPAQGSRSAGQQQELAGSAPGLQILVGTAGLG